MAVTGAEIASAYVTLQVKMPGVGADINRALGGSDTQRVLADNGKSIGAALTGAIGGAVAVATSKAVSMVTGAIGDAVKRVDTMNNFPKIMKNLGYSAKDATKSINKMSDGLKGLPTSLDSMAGMVQQLAPLTGGLGEATDLSLALNNALLAGGKSTDIQANAMEQYTQMLAIGKVDMAAWRSMVAAMPGQMDQLSVSLLGAGNKSMDLYEAMKSGKVTFAEFNDAVLKLNSEGVGAFASFEQQARDSTDGIGTGWANLQTAITRNLATIIQKLKPTIDAFLVGATQIANALGPAAIGVIDVALAVGEWAAANKDWLIPATAVVGALVAYYKAVQLVRAVKVAYAAASYGAIGATYASGIASKIGAAAYAIQNSSLVRLIASLRANEALSLRSKIAIVASTVATSGATIAQRALNVALKANPIGLVITAVTALVGALVWFVTQTDTGKAIWGEFTRFLGEAWANVSGFFKTVWETVLKPVFDGVAAVVTWIWQTILQPTFQFISFAFAVMAGIFVGVYEAILKPVFDAIGKIVGWLWNTIVKPYFGLIKAYFVVIGNIVSWLWTNAVQPAFNFIGAIIRSVWVGFIKPVFDAMWAIIKNTLGPVSTWLRDTVIAPVWNGIKAVIDSVWKNGIKPVIDTMVRIVKSDPKKAFEAARDGIKTAWEAIKEIAKKPVRFVVETVINGLIGTMNKIPGVNLSKVSLPKGFSDGGYTGNISANAVAGVVHGDEHVIRSASRRAIEARHPGLLDHMNRFGSVPGYKRGGLVHPLPGAVVTTNWMGYPNHTGIDLAKPQGTPIQAAADGIVSKQFYHVNYGNMVDLDHGGGMSTRYAHMLANVAVKLGQVVKAGQVIGYEGSTGNSTGPHLHFEVLRNGNPTDPAPYLSGASSINPVMSMVGGLIDFATGAFSKAFPGGGMWIEAAGGIMKSGVKSVVDWATEKLSIGGAKLYDQGGIIPHGGVGVNLSGKPEAVLTNDEARGYKALMRALSGSGGLQGVGGNVLDGLVAGLRGGRSGVEGAVREVTSAIIGTANRELDIHSPSRVFRTIGKYIGAGLSAGITGSVAATRTATERLVRSVVTGFDQLGGERSSLQKKLDKALGNWRTSKAGTKAKAAYAAQIADYRQQIAQINSTIGAPGKSKGPALIAQLTAQTTKLNAIALQRAQVAKKLAAAQKVLAESADQMADWSAGIQEKINGLGGIASKSTVPGMVANLTKRIEQTKTFAQTIAKLKSLGLDGASMQELTEQFASTGSSRAAEALLASGKSGVKQVVDLRKQLDAAGGALGDQVGAVLYQAGIDSAKGLIKGLQSQEKALQAQAQKIADTITQTVKRTLKIKSPSRVMDGLGQWTGLGFAGGLEATQPIVASAAEALFRVPDSFGDSLQASRQRAKSHALDLSAASQGGGGITAGQRLYIVLDDGTALGGYVDRRADSVVRREVGSQSRGSFRRDGGF